MRSSSTSRFNWGAFAEYIRVPAHIVAQNMHRVPAALPFAQAALIEPLACALHGVRDAAIQLGDTVAIIGAGAQGLDAGTAGARAVARRG